MVSWPNGVSFTTGWFDVSVETFKIFVPDLPGWAIPLLRLDHLMGFPLPPRHQPEPSRVIPDQPMQ